jgi:hypothetical protein
MTARGERVFFGHLLTAYGVNHIPRLKQAKYHPATIERAKGLVHYFSSDVTGTVC